ncbi:SagB family peptide dehydrogenase [Goodfellowiella coeruleoviolacea]|uniref:SagB-type dehydrogenase domain-containing protein n=1 Tax=Goodfellowiella coeruleoviolacea TaxID=334858 RepID=A0AAE3GDV1_9PSEU|nr:SagB family peptide dehydrogenase [Goodfellowiella coeruleoviolacea]MCP2165540.1 SagB-type dehydrogenase domain-containing protein [Goodfellowiella coeruleoviolacea]
MRIKVAEHAALFYRDGDLVWDDYLRHRQFQLTETAELLCRRFARFTDVDELLAPLGGPERATIRSLIDELLDARVLIAEDSAEHRAERGLLAAWSSWGAGARHYHFASRTLRDTPYQDADEHDAALEARLSGGEAAPPPFRRRATEHGPAPLPLPALPQRPDWAAQGLLDVLLRRRTDRAFAAGPLPVAELAHLLRLLGGVSPSRPAIGRSGTVFKTSPSGGGRHPVELYVHASDVEGVGPGWYHYDGLGHALEPLGPAWDRERVVAAAGDQDWVGAAPALLVYTGVLDRTRWRYDTARAYRVVQMDVGHLSQTAYLIATAMGLGVGFTAALRDELVEEALGCDPHHEIVLGLTAIGPLPM